MSKQIKALDGELRKAPADMFGTPCDTPAKLAGHDNIELVDVGSGEQPSFLEEVVAGLSKPNGQRSLPYRFLYDARGSQLFADITRLREYYPTNAELDILRRYGHQYAGACGNRCGVVELGSGNATKAKLLLPPFCAQSEEALHYVPIDISRSALVANATVLTGLLPGLRITALVGEYRAGLAALDEVLDRPRVICWLGGSIGNMPREVASQFLGTLAPQIGEGGCVLVGIDLRKDKEVLERAYDDSEGVTAEFNLNLLHRMRRELGAEVSPSQFKHVAEYDVETGRVAMFLESSVEQEIQLPGEGFVARLEAGERIHPESSFKYSFDEIEEVALGAGLAVAERWLDADGLFSLNRLVLG